MDNSKNPLADDMDHIDGNSVSSDDSGDNQDDQLVDLENPMLHTIENNDVIDNSAGFDNSEVGSEATQGLTPMHRQNIDEARVDEVLVEDNLDDSDYPDIVDIADSEAATHTNSDDL